MLRAQRYPAVATYHVDKRFARHGQCTVVTDHIAATVTELRRRPSREACTDFLWTFPATCLEPRAQCFGIDFNPDRSKRRIELHRLRQVESACEPARITPVFGQVWPPSLPQIGAVSVTFDAGYGAASDVPEGIKSWIKLRVGSLYTHREEMAVLSRGRIDPLPFVQGLLDPYRVVLV